MSATITRRCFTVDEYHRMGEAGILRPDERVELIRGEVVEMAPIGSRHMACVLRLQRGFERRVGDRAVVSIQNPVRLSPHVEPQPDVVLLRFRDDLYASGLPGPDDVLLLIEVADTTFEYDQDVKLPLYAAAGIPEVWIADIDRDRVLRHRDPKDGRYQEVTIHTRGETLSPQALPDVAITVDEILGEHDRAQ